MAEMLKEVANRYKVLATLGEGGMGTVYLVEDTTNGNQVALKVLLSSVGTDANSLLQFKQEFRLMSKLKHPNNCAVYDYGQLPDGTPYFTMEVVPGKGLDEMIPTSAEEMTNILRQICDALGFIHQQGFVHCDLKPENIRLTPEGTVKLMDFGLMEVAGQSGGAIKGTLAYLAPEVAKRDRIDQRSDIYSLGAVTYQMLTGETPFKGATPIEVLRAHLNQQPRALRELNGAIPALMDQVVLKMMAKEPIARFQSAYDVLSALGIEVSEGMGASLLASAFIGRAGELSTLQEALQTVKRDRKGQTLWLTGGAGVGKTRLLGEFRFCVQLEEIPFLQGTCNQQRAPYGVFVEVLRQLLPVVKENSPETVDKHGPLISKLVPEYGTGATVPTMEPEQEKILLQAAISELIIRGTAKTGGVLVVEDWDLADPLSIETMTYLLRNAAESPLVVVGSSRDKALVKGAEIALDPLTLPELTDMIESMLGVETIPAGLASQIADLTGGNPQFAGNLLEHLLRTSVLAKSKGKWQLPEAIAPEDLPGDVKDLLLERFTSLSEAGRAVANLAAILGQPFGLTTACDLLGLDENALFDACDELMQAKLFMSEERLYSFSTAELKDALYNHLPIEERIALHTRVAEYMESQLPAEGEPDLNTLTTMAHHFLKSRHQEKAIRFALQAATRNRELTAIDAAIGLLEAGWALLNGLDNPSESLRCQYMSLLAAVYTSKNRLVDADPYLEPGIELATRLGDKASLLELLATKLLYCSFTQTPEKLKEGIGLYDQIMALADEVGNTRLRARAGVNTGRLLFFSGQNARAQEVFQATADYTKAQDIPYYYARSACFLGYLLVTGGEATRELGYKYLDEAVEIQERIGDKFGLGYTLNILATLQLVMGRFKNAYETAERHAKIMGELGLPDDHVIAMLNQAIALLQMGDFAKATEVGEACHKAGVAANSKMGVPIVLANLACASMHRGDLKKAEEYIKESQAKAREASSYVLSYVIPNVIETYLYLGRLEAAMGAAQEARDLVTSTGNTEIETRLWVNMGEIHARLGEDPAARSYFERAREHAVKNDEQHILARAERGLAQMEVATGSPDAAEQHLQKAFQLARAIPLRYLEADCYYLQGQLALARNQQGEALGYFQEATSLAQELGVPDLESLALHGQAKSNPNTAQAKELLKDAKAKQLVLVEQLDEKDQEHFLTFMERAQLKRDEGVKALAAVAGTPVEAPPALAEEATSAERVEWLTQSIAAAAGQQAAEATRLSQIAGEFARLMEKGVSDERVAELEAQNRRMEQLIKFSMAVSNVQDLNKVLEQAVDFIVEITAAERGFLLFFENGQIRSQVSRVNVDRRSPMDWQFSKSIAEKVLTTGEVVCVFDALSDTQFNQSKSVVDLNLRTVICVPMRIKGKMIGAIYVDRQSINENFTPSDLELVMSLAAQASSAIENARLHQEWVEKSKRLEMLNELSKTISGSLDMEEVLDLIVKMTLEISRAERGFLFLLDDDRRRLICRAARDTRMSLPLDEDHEISQSICTKVLTSGEPENVADALNDEEFQFQQSIMALNLRMVMCVPIIAKGQVIGLLYVDSQAVVNAFSDKDLDLMTAIAGHASVSIENAKLHARTMKLAEEVQKTFYSFVTALGSAIDAKHPLTAGHSYRVTEYSVRLARRLGLSEPEVEKIRIAGILHDVGKIGTPDHILMKPGSFTNEEYEIMKKHVVHTKEILDNIYFSEDHQDIPAIAGAHHEKWNGTGYPNGQKGEEIPMGGRILAFGDVFDAITSKRDYREAMPLSQALNIIRQGIGSHFDPSMGEAFIQMIEEEGVVYYDKDPHNQPPAPAPQEANA